VTGNIDTQYEYYSNSYGPYKEGRKVKAKTDIKNKEERINKHTRLYPKYSGLTL
jgi:hypothetical protein